MPRLRPSAVSEQPRTNPHNSSRAFRSGFQRSRRAGSPRRVHECRSARGTCRLRAATHLRLLPAAADVHGHCATHRIVQTRLQSQKVVQHLCPAQPRPRPRPVWAPQPQCPSSNCLASTPPGAYDGRFSKSPDKDFDGRRPTEWRDWLGFILTDGDRRNGAIGSVSFRTPSGPACPPPPRL